MTTSMPATEPAPSLEICTATMVICTQRSRLRYALDVVLTLLAWLAFAYLFAQGIWAVGTNRVEELEMPFLSRAQLSMNTLSIYALAMLLQGLLLVLWALYNWGRFRGKQRRNTDTAVSDESLTRSYGIDASTLQRLRTQPISVIYHTADGSIAAVEPLWSTAGKSSEQAHSARQPPALV
ncbi:MAG: poly-beta-1,6-N-acetyl-D-glucosamine biosynthesis protein PgaD [Acidovorax sp.]|jgi:biofilm PGA synthesis protein PgaD|nr:poly-beta-1,6-N-acetyl-D-glucosamine biosynthesis protein PgaD [Acidovorax sp.]